MDSIIAQSRGHSELFDIIDELRLQGISQYVALPEIVVCGDQSSGKSSVLEAISGMSFPTKDTLCTRFPTELVLRRAPASDSSCKVSINPDPERPESEQDTLRGFRRDVDISSLDLSQVVEDATKAMGISDEQRRFSKDVLRIELSGPTQPHLTLIDLPGIWASDTKEQSEDDLEAVKKMVSEYAARERCIILAVVSAQIEATNQSTTKFIRDVDPGRQRTMGLITKPDDPSPGSGREASFINLAQNNSIVFRHGWHVLRNRSFEERNHTRAQRDKTERNFFSRSQWNIEPLQGKLGVASLKPRLSNLLREQIITHLPGFIAEVSAEIKDVEAKLERLGQPRKTIGAKRQYLIDVSKEFTSLATAAVDGNYNGDFFHDPRTPEGAKQHLRATVQATLEDLSTDIQQRGRARRIVDTEEHFEEGSGRISRDDYVDEVKDLMRRTRGRELPGTFNPAIIEILFKQQCKPWTGLVDECLDKIVTATQALVESVLDTVTAPETRSGILQRASEGIAGAKEELGKKAREILSQFTVTHPITYNHYLTDTVQKVQQERRNRGLDQILGSYNLDRYGYLSVTPEALKSALSGHMETSMGNFSSLLAIDYAEAYYKVCTMTRWRNRQIETLQTTNDTHPRRWPPRSSWTTFPSSRWKSAS